RHTRSKRDWSSDVCSSDLNSPGIITAIATHCSSKLDQVWRHSVFLIVPVFRRQSLNTQSQSLITIQKVFVTCLNNTANRLLLSLLNLSPAIWALFRRNQTFYTI